jgi:dTDP-4-amino-4,6-dideoxygalactose transaminase
MSDPERIPFSRPAIVGAEATYIDQALREPARQGGGRFTRQCHAALSGTLGGADVLLTQSCTAALEMAALLCDVKPGDEIIMPSFTFVSGANAFVLHGAVPVFVDIDAATQNLDPESAAQAITPRTRAIVPTHYAGIGADMPRFRKLAAKHQLRLIEDAAQGFLATLDGKPLGTLGDIGALSFHDTKNVSSGEGGALVLSDPALLRRAEIVWEKGTNRAEFHRGAVDKYTWVDVGASYLPSEITAAFLLAQLEQRERITQARREIWASYHERLAGVGRSGGVSLPHVPSGAFHNGHLYYLILESKAARDRLLQHLNQRGIGAVFHYVPLHSSPGGRRYARVVGEMPSTDRAGNCLVRLPLWAGMTEEHVDRVVRGVQEFFGTN